MAKSQLQGLPYCLCIFPGLAKVNLCLSMFFLNYSKVIFSKRMMKLNDNQESYHTYGAIQIIHDILGWPGVDNMSYNIFPLETLFIMVFGSKILV